MHQGRAYGGNGSVKQVLFITFMRLLNPAFQIQFWWKYDI